MDRARVWFSAERASRRLVLFASALAIATALVVMAMRWPQPLALEWMEGGIVDHIRVVLAGAPLYREPSLEFTPFLYTPLYYWVCAAPAWLFGASFQVARAVSILAIGACFWMIHGFVRRETGDRSSAHVSLGLFAATYGFADRWFDIARPDSLAMAFLLAGIWLARFGRTSMHAGLAGLAFFAAFFTKQSMLILCAPALAYMLLQSRTRGIVAGSTLAVSMLAAWAAMDGATEGWFGWYVFVMPAQHHMHWEVWHELLVDHLFAAVGPMMMGAIVVALAPGTRQRWERLLWVALAGVAVWTGWMGVLHDGGGVNAFIPAYAVLAVASGIAIASLRARLASASPRKVVALELFVLLQFALLAYKPWRYVPSRADLAVLDGVLAEIGATPGEVWMPGFGHYRERMEREGTQAHAMALLDVFKTRDDAVKNKLAGEIRAALRKRRFAKVVFGTELDMMPPELREPLERHYVLDDHLFTGFGDRAMPTSGYSTRPDRVYVPKPRRSRRKS